VASAWPPAGVDKKTFGTGFVAAHGHGQARRQVGREWEEILGVTHKRAGGPGLDLPLQRDRRRFAFSLSALACAQSGIAARSERTDAVLTHG
jgi:hypothetical protein